MRAFAELDRVTEELDRLLVDVLTSVLSVQATPCRDELGAGLQAKAWLAIHDRADDEYLGVTIRLGLPLARVLAGRMMTVPEPSGEDVLDAVGELVNIAGGNVKSLFCPHARLSLPSSELLEADGAAVRGIALGAVVLDQLVGLTLSPGVPALGLLWPPAHAPEGVDTR
jgi:Chemotaxis phosphatase CheX